MNKLFDSVFDWLAVTIAFFGIVIIAFGLFHGLREGLSGDIEGVDLELICATNVSGSLFDVPGSPTWPYSNSCQMIGVNSCLYYDMRGPWGGGDKPMRTVIIVDANGVAHQFGVPATITPNGDGGFRITP